MGWLVTLLEGNSVRHALEQDGRLAIYSRSGIGTAFVMTMRHQKAICIVEV